MMMMVMVRCRTLGWRCG